MPVSFVRSTAGYYSDFYAVPAAALAAVGLELWERGPSLAYVALVAEGLLAWTLVEYWTHRALFHATPWVRDQHERHHDSPSALVGVGPLVTWPLVVGALVLMGGAGVGLALGYLAYIAAHDAIHHGKIGPRHVLYRAKLRHGMHHAGADGNYGVATHLWDVAFGTHVPPRRKGTR